MIDAQPPAAEESELRRYSWNGLTTERAKELAAVARAVPGLVHSDADDGFYIAARYADVRDVHDDPATFSSTPSVFRPLQGNPPFPALEMDPPQHEIWRDVFRELVNPRTVKKLEPQILADVDRHIDSFIADGEADLVAQLAEHVPVETICRVGGIEDMDVAATVGKLARAALEAGGRDADAFLRHLGAFAAYVLPIVNERRAAPGDDFLSHVATLEIDGAPLSDQAVWGVLFGLFGAGHHSTTSSMASLFANVLSRPAILAALREQPQLITAAIEESLRIDPPFYGFFRRATKDTTVAGTAIGADESILLNWLSANHDAAQFADPDDFRLDRGANKHVAFGWGIHLCVGAPLARLELKIALERVLARLANIELVNTPAKYFGGAGATYVDAVRVRFTPGRPRD